MHTQIVARSLQALLCIPCGSTPIYGLPRRHACATTCAASAHATTATCYRVRSRMSAHALSYAGACALVCRRVRSRISAHALFKAAHSMVSVTKGSRRLAYS